MSARKAAEHFFMALDISKFTPLEKFREAMNSYIQYIKSCPTNK